MLRATWRREIVQMEEVGGPFPLVLSLHQFANQLYATPMCSGFKSHFNAIAFSIKGKFLKWG
jgi:hypothetical protein